MPLDEKQIEMTELPADVSEELPEDAASADTAEIYETSADILREAGRETRVRRRREPNENVRSGVALFLILLVTALIVSLVHAITADRIAAAAEGERQAAVMRIFGADASMTAIDPLEGTTAVYMIADTGYAVYLDTEGFAAPIGMMVGVGSDGRIVGVELMSHSEAPGYGARVNDPLYLGRYIGQGSRLVLGDTVDALAGATVTSRAVLSGVNAATAALVEAGLVEEVLPPPPVEEEPMDDPDMYYDWEDEDWMDGGDGE